MDLTQFNRLKELDSPTKKEFDSPLKASTHKDVDIHNIGDSIPSPTIIEDIGTATVGASPYPAREDHVHGIGGTFGLNNGSSGSPSLYFLSDTNTGMYRVSSDTIGFTVGGSLNLSVSTSQTKVYGNLKVESYVRTEGNIQASENDSNKTVHIGTGISNYTTWGVVQGKNASILLGNVSNDSCYFRNRTASGTLYMGTRNTNDVWIQGSDGVFVVGKNIAVSSMATTTGFNTVRYNTTFGLLQQFVSKRAYKAKIKEVDYDYIGRIVDQLRPVTFIDRYMGGSKKESAASKKWREADLRYGFIAEEVWEVADGHLSTTEVKDGELIPSAWDETAMLAVAVAEIKNLRKRLAKVEKQLTGKENLS